LSIEIARDGAVAVVTVDRQDALNALNVETLTELRDRLRELSIDNDVRAVVLTGAGEKAFVAGADIKYMSGLGSDEAKGWGGLGHDAGRLLETMAKPTIAAINGFALGGGCELALACDFVYASDKAKFGQPEVNLGVIPGFGGTQRLPRRIGAGRAMELILTGDMVGADEALRIGLVNKVFPATELMAEAKKCADKIASKGPLAIAYARRAVRKGAELNLPAGNDYEAELFALLFATQDQKEGMRAFLAKRPAKFEGK
jgi:enoyl-CoA hydratase